MQNLKELCYICLLCFGLSLSQFVHTSSDYILWQQKSHFVHALQDLQFICCVCVLLAVRCKFVENLQSPPEGEPEAESRLGPAIPICCPRHRTWQRNMRAPGEFATHATWSKLCAQPCATRLPWCDHSCHLACHSPVLKPHTSAIECAEHVPRPCAEHSDVALLCGQVFGASNARKEANLDDALKHFTCEVPVQVQRGECNHSVALPCHRAKAVNSGNEMLSPCQETVGNWYHPICNHVRPKSNCAQRLRWVVEFLLFVLFVIFVACDMCFQHAFVLTKCIETLNIVRFSPNPSFVC